MVKIMMFLIIIKTIIIFLAYMIIIKLINLINIMKKVHQKVRNIQLIVL